MCPLLDGEAVSGRLAFVLCLRDIRAQDEVVCPVRDEEIRSLRRLSFTADAVVPRAGGAAASGDLRGMTNQHEAMATILLSSTSGEDVASAADEEACAGGGEAVHIRCVPDAAGLTFDAVDAPTVIPRLATNQGAIGRVDFEASISAAGDIRTRYIDSVDDIVCCTNFTATSRYRRNMLRRFAHHHASAQSAADADVPQLASLVVEAEDCYAESDVPDEDVLDAVGTVGLRRVIPQLSVQEDAANVRVHPILAGRRCR